jgi:hypothetical protein
MLKFCGERLLPLSSFESKGSNGTPTISINITSVGEAKVEQAEVIDSINITDVEYNERTDS